MCRRAESLFLFFFGLTAIFLMAGILVAGPAYAAQQPFRVYVGVIEPEFEGITPDHLKVLRSLAEIAVAQLGEGQDQGEVQIDTQHWLKSDSRKPQAWLVERDWSELAKEGKTHFLIIHARRPTGNIRITGNRSVEAIVEIAWEMGKIAHHLGTEPAPTFVKMMKPRESKVLYIGLVTEAGQQFAQTGIIENGWQPQDNPANAVTKLLDEMIKYYKPELRLPNLYFVSCLKLMGAESVPADQRKQFNDLRWSILDKIYEKLAEVRAKLKYSGNRVPGIGEAEGVCNNHQLEPDEWATDYFIESYIEGQAVIAPRPEQDVFIRFKDYGWHRRNGLPGLPANDGFRDLLRDSDSTFQRVRGLGTRAHCVKKDEIWKPEEVDKLASLLAKLIIEKLVRGQEATIEVKPCTR